VAVRRWLMDTLPSPRVLDLYCGASGRMWQEVWRDAEAYLGVDKEQPHNHATTLRMSAERAVQSLAIDEYNVYDLDCYVSPWLVARRILHRRADGRFGLAFTCGEERGMKDQSNEIVRVSIGARGLSDYRLLTRYADLIVHLMVRSLTEIAGIKLVSGVVAKRVRQNTMFYGGLLLDKLPRSIV